MKKKKGPALPKLFTAFKRSSPITPAGTFDSDGFAMSAKGIEDGGEHLFELADFVKVAELGSGAQGVVNEVAHTKSGEHFALKMQPLQQDDDVLKKQMLELKTLRKSRHPNVVGLYDAFYSDGYVYTLLELMDSGTLQSVVAKGPVPEPQLGKIAVQLVDALVYIHKEFHVLHRDIVRSCCC